MGASNRKNSPSRILGPPCTPELAVLEVDGSLPTFIASRKVILSTLAKRGYRRPMAKIGLGTIPRILQTGGEEAKDISKGPRITGLKEDSKLLL